MAYLRLDTALVERGLTDSRSQAQHLINANAVEIFDAGQWLIADKPSRKVTGAQQIRITSNDALKYVSRAGLKLEKALSVLNLDLSGWIALDVGQSTGGFTDCLLKHGISKVVGVDVGHDQLAEKLRQDHRVVCLEGVNARDLPEEQILNYAPSGFDLVVIDVSFISQRLILPGLVKVIKPGGFMLSLVKPQFEVGKDAIGKGGIVKNTALYVDVEVNIRRQLEESGFDVQDYFESPITGSDGNREFLVIAIKQNKNPESILRNPSSLLTLEE